MGQTILFFGLILGIYGTVEFYGWQAIRTALNPGSVSTARIMYWGVSMFLLATVISYRPLHKFLPRIVFLTFGVLFLILLLSKLIMLLFLLPEDLVRTVRWVVAKFSSGPPTVAGITRSQFLSRLAIVAGAIPAGALVYGVVANAYNYTFRKVAIKFPNLPEAFNGYRIIQLSDIHSGSFNRTEPLIEAVKKINAMNADLILFTGDLVNDRSDEMDPYMEVFDKLRAKHGVISTTGNHDYGDYTDWGSVEAKKANFERFKGVHKQLGWNLLMNENVILEQGGDKIAIIGIENWGKLFPRKKGG